MNEYLEMKKRNQYEVNKFPKFFAFTKKRFEEQIIKRGLDPKNDLDKVLYIGGGGYMLRSDKEKFDNMLERHNKELSDAIAANKNNFIVDMFTYELANHEYSVTKDVFDTLSAVGLTREDVNNNKALRKGLAEAIKQYMATCEY